jgi:hypothetical protein
MGLLHTVVMVIKSERNGSRAWTIVSTAERTMRSYNKRMERSVRIGAGRSALGGGGGTGATEPSSGDSSRSDKPSIRINLFFGPVRS